MSALSPEKMKIYNQSYYIYDFTTGCDKVYYEDFSYKEVSPGIWAMMGGDGKADGQINNQDKIDVWAFQSGMSGYLNGDFNLNAQTDNTDRLEIWSPNVGSGAKIP